MTPMKGKTLIYDEQRDTVVSLAWIAGRMNEGKSMRALAKELGVNHSTLWRALKRGNYVKENHWRAK